MKEVIAQASLGIQPADAKNDDNVIHVGDMRFFKTDHHRGHPLIGEVTRVMRHKTQLRDRSGKMVKVTNDLVGRPYVFHPYNTKKRQEARAEARENRRNRTKENA